MKRVSIADAKQTLPALVHEVERLGEVELTRRGKTVAYLVSAGRHGTAARATFTGTLERWRAVFGADLGDEALTLPARGRARPASLPA